MPAPILRPIRPVRVAAVAPPKADVTWGIKALKVPALWKQGITGKGILIGHLDTGANGTHPALKGARLPTSLSSTGSAARSPRRGRA